MANVVDSVFTWQGKYPQRGELSAKTFITNMLPLNNMSRLGIEVWTDIQSKMHFGRTSVAEGVLRKKAADCAVSPIDIGKAISDLVLEVKPLDLFATQCGDVISNTYLEVARKKGIQIDDLTDTEISEILLRIITPTLSRDLQRVMYFGDTTLTNDKFDLMDGYFKLILADSSIPNVAIADDYFDTAGNAVKIFREVFSQSSTELKSFNDDELGDNAQLLFTVSGSVYDALIADMSNPDSNTSTYQGFVVQPTGVTFRGIPIVPVRLWDWTVEKYFTTSGNPLKPHKLILTTRNNLMFGTDDEADLTRLDMWYQRNERKTYFESQFMGGVQLRDPNLISCGGI